MVKTVGSACDSDGGLWEYRIRRGIALRAQASVWPLRIGLLCCCRVRLFFCGCGTSCSRWQFLLIQRILVWSPIQLSLALSLLFFLTPRFNSQSIELPRVDWKTHPTIG